MDVTLKAPWDGHAALRSFPYVTHLQTERGYIYASTDTWFS
jgi:hypothetical protein